MLPYFANFRLLAEFSTPCVNQRYVPSRRRGALRQQSSVLGALLTVFLQNANALKVVGGAIY